MSNASEAYRLIWQAVRARSPIAFVYKGYAREACPVILGYAADGREALIAYQFAGDTSQKGSLPNWRCFSVHEIHAVTLRGGRWHETGSHKQAQSCVQHVDVDVNIPDTLTRARPLPFGSPLLTSPRRAR